MRIEVVGRDVEITPAIREYAEAKAQKLPRYFDRVMHITITLTKEDSHRRGDFGADFVINVEKHPPFIAKSSDSDLYAAIDQVVAKSQRQLHDFKEKLKQGNR